MSKRSSFERLFKNQSPRNDILVVGLNIKKWIEKYEEKQKNPTITAQEYILSNQNLE